MQLNINSINAQFDWMANSSNNIANINTDNYKAIDTTIESVGSSNGISVGSTIGKESTNLAKEMVDQSLISTGVDANVDAIKTQDDMIGTLLDTLA